MNPEAIPVVDALAVALVHEPVPEAQRVAGSPTTATAVLPGLDGQECGIWEMTPGAMSDVEADEIFVVIAGAATVEFVDDGITLNLAPGSVGHLTQGARTIWTVTETLRKIYVTPAGEQ